MLKNALAFLGLLATASAADLLGCLEKSKEVLNTDISDLEKLEAYVNEWKESCAEMLPENVGSPNKDLNVQLQTYLIFADAALVYYSYYLSNSIQFYAITKFIKDFYNWAIISKVSKPNKGFECFAYNAKVIGDLYGYYDNTFGNSPYMLLDFQDIRESCPNSPLLYISEFINKYLIPPSTPPKQDEVAITEAYGVCLTLTAIAAINTYSTANNESVLNSVELFLNYGTSIYMWQQAKVACWGFIFN